MPACPAAARPLPPAPPSLRSVRPAASAASPLPWPPPPHPSLLTCASSPPPPQWGCRGSQRPGQEGTQEARHGERVSTRLAGGAVSEEPSRAGERSTRRGAQQVQARSAEQRLRARCLCWVSCMGLYCTRLCGGATAHAWDAAHLAGLDADDGGRGLGLQLLSLRHSSRGPPGSASAAGQPVLHAKWTLAPFRLLMALLSCAAWPCPGSAGPWHLDQPACRAFCMAAPQQLGAAQATLRNGRDGVPGACSGGRAGAP